MVFFSAVRDLREVEFRTCDFLKNVFIIVKMSVEIGKIVKKNKSDLQK